MISGVEVEIDGELETFRLSTRAIMAIEDKFDADIATVMERLNSGARVSSIVAMFAAIANDGRGQSTEWAQDAFDSLGFERAVAIFEKVAERAFPEARKGAGQAAARGKKSNPARK